MNFRIQAGTEKTPWARFGQADSLLHSKGERALRVDLTKLFKEGGKALEGSLDKAHHLSIILQKEEVYECVELGGDKPFKAGWRGVAVKIAEESIPDEVNGFKKQYVILNINSLAKRLGVSKDVIKKQEEAGTVDAFIKSRLNEISEGQEKLLKLLKTVRETIIKGDPYVIKQEEKVFLTNFLKNEMDHLCWGLNVEEFCKNCAEIKSPPDWFSQPLHFIYHLSEEIWWSSKDFETHPKKLELTDENVACLSFSTDRPEDKYSNKGIPILKDFKFYHGQALDRQGHLGQPMNRMQLFDWDKDNRYAIAVGDYVYNSRPFCKDKRMVPLQLEQGPHSNSGKWILVNVHSLSRLGLEKSAILKAANSNDDNGALAKLILEKGKILATFNTYFEADFEAIIERVVEKSEKGLSINNSVYNFFKAFIEDYSFQHPDEELRKIFQEIVKECAKIRFSRDEQGVNHFKEWAQEQKAKITELKAYEVTIKKKDSAKTFSYKFGRPSMPDGNETCINNFYFMKKSAKKVSGSFFHFGHAGYQMHRINFFDWDKQGRYAVAGGKKIYPFKPSYHPKNQVPMVLSMGFYGPSSWILVNRHSLGRLGISSEEIDKAVQTDELHSLIHQKVELIKKFAESFSHLEKDIEAKKEGEEISFSKISNSLASVSSKIDKHPNEEVKKVMKEAMKPYLSLSVEELGSLKQPISLFNDLKAKIVEAGGVGA